MKRLTRLLCCIMVCLLPMQSALAVESRAPAPGATLGMGTFAQNSNAVVKKHIIDSQWYSQTTPVQADRRYAWSTDRLTELPVNGGRDLYARIRSEGCYAAAIAMVFANLNLQSLRPAYDPRTQTVDFLQPDPVTITLANMNYPADDADIMKYSRDPIYMYSSYTLATDFGASYVNLDATAQASKNKSQLVAGLLDGPAKQSGVIVRIRNLTGGTHFIVVSGYVQYADGTYDFYICDPMDRSMEKANVLMAESATGINYKRTMDDITGLRYFKK